MSDQLKVRQSYHVAVRIDGDTIRVSALIGNPAYRGLPTTTLTFQPVQSDPALYPITIHWKSETPQHKHQQAAVERAVLDYCGRLFSESAYQGPIDCCF